MTTKTKPKPLMPKLTAKAVKEAAQGKKTAFLDAIDNPPPGVAQQLQALGTSVAEVQQTAHKLFGKETTDADDAGIGAPAPVPSKKPKAPAKTQYTTSHATKPTEDAAFEYITNSSSGSRYVVLGVGPGMYRLSMNLRLYEQWAKSLSPIRAEFRVRIGDSELTPHAKPMAKDIGLANNLNDNNWGGGGEGYRSMAGTLDIANPESPDPRICLRNAFYPQLYESLKVSFPQFVLIDYEQFTKALDSFITYTPQPPKQQGMATQWYMNPRMNTKVATGKDAPTPQDASEAGL